MNSPSDYLRDLRAAYTTTDQKTALNIYKPRDPFAHKGTFGHALLLAGSYGKMGAAVLASRACLRTGAGLLTAYLPGCGYSILQTALPEAMVMTDPEELLISLHPTHLETYQSAGIGPGIGTEQETARMVKSFLKEFKQPLVVDADALNIMSHSNQLLGSLRPETILTPHPKEFDRLFGASVSETLRFEKAKAMAIQYEIIIVLKGHFTGVFFPDGKISFNTSGNAGMATGGSGDVLTGILTSLLAQGYKAADAAVLGVYLHGHAGDLAAASCSQEAMLPGDLIKHLGKSFLMFSKEKK